MMANWKLANAMLSDHFGPWCAWCAGYIMERKQLEDHHVLSPKGKIRERFGLEPPVVPVHRHPRQCHRERLQYFADAAGSALMRASELPPSELDSTTSRCHGYGN